MGSAPHDLLTALRHAESRAEEDPWGSPYHVRYAQAVLDIAVEWSMPTVERWAVAWLKAAGGSHLRLRWSSRSRDGKVRRDGLAPGRVTALATGPGKVIIGCRSGPVASWTDDAGLRKIGESESAVWALAAREDRVFAAGARGYFLTTPETWKLPSLREGLRGVGSITAAAISEAGFVACGSEAGRVWVCPPNGNWIAFPQPDKSPVRALCFRADATLRAVWKAGWVAESQPLSVCEWVSSGPQRLETDQWPGAEVSAAAFDTTGEWLAVAVAGVVAVAKAPSIRLTEAWSHPGVRSVAWSPDGLLTSSGAGTLRVGEPDTPEPGVIRSETADGPVAFLGADHIVTAQDVDVVQWAVGEAGSYVLDIDSEDVISAVAADPADPGRTMAGTQLGRVLCYDGRGSPTPLFSGKHIQGRVQQIIRSGDEWLIAAQTGPYRCTLPPGAAPSPGAMPRRLGIGRLCRAVAASGQDAAFASNNQVFTLSGAPPLAFGTAVRDIRMSADGSIAAIDDRGTLCARDLSGADWSPQLPAREGWRLLAVDGQFIEVWNPNGKAGSPDGEVLRVSRYGSDRRLGGLPADATTVLRFDSRRVVLVCRDRGLGMAEVGAGQAGRSFGVATRVTTADTDGRRIVAASGKRIVGYDLLEPAETDGGGLLTLTATLAEGTCSVELPGGTVLQLSPEQVSELRTIQNDRWEELRKEMLGENPAADWLGEEATRIAVEQQSKLVTVAGSLGDQIWQSGLAIAVDGARGEDPDQRVRIEWRCDDEADEIPWELVHRSAAPLGWFDDPPITVVRSIRPRQTRRQADPPARGQLARHPMLVIRGAEFQLRTSDETYAWTRRRTRHSNVSLRSSQPTIIDNREALDRALADSVDILQIWAHCGPHKVRFSPRAAFDTAELADKVARCAPRLAVLVGCRSGALGRALVHRGVEAVVAMRVEVYSLTIQPLVADLVSLVLDGVPIDLAFAEALRSYVLTGQPGAAAVPLLYLAEGSSGQLFSTTASAVSAPVRDSHEDAS
jgi:hypothetical protein